MSDAADRLAQALRDLVNEAVDLAIASARQEAPGLRTSMTPRSQAHLRNMKIKGTTRYTPPPGERPRDPVDEEIRREYEKRFGEPAPKVWVWRTSCDASTRTSESWSRLRCGTGVSDTPPCRVVHD
jgi:hypothetical protein